MCTRLRTYGLRDRFAPLRSHGLNLMCEQPSYELSHGLVDFDSRDAAFRTLLPRSLSVASLGTVVSSSVKIAYGLSTRPRRGHGSRVEQGLQYVLVCWRMASEIGLCCFALTVSVLCWSSSLYALSRGLVDLDSGDASFLTVLTKEFEHSIFGGQL